MKLCLRLVLYECLSDVSRRFRLGLNWTRKLFSCFSLSHLLHSLECSFWENSYLWNKQIYYFPQVWEQFVDLPLAPGGSTLVLRIHGGAGNQFTMLSCCKGKLTCACPSVGTGLPPHCSLLSQRLACSAPAAAPYHVGPERSCRGSGKSSSLL